MKLSFTLLTVLISLIGLSAEAEVISCSDGSGRTGNNYLFAVSHKTAVVLVESAGASTIPEWRPLGEGKVLRAYEATSTTVIVKVSQTVDWAKVPTEKCFEANGNEYVFTLAEVGKSELTAIETLAQRKTEACRSHSPPRLRPVQIPLVCGRVETVR